jgi:hypothetical protein
MNTALTVAIPADVKDNSTHTVEIRWRDNVPVSAESLDRDRQYANIYGYTWHDWDDIDRDGRRVTLHRVVNKIGHTVALYETSYYTRVKCTDCDNYWAQHYIAVTDADGVTHPAAPFCGTHGDVVKKIADRTPGHTWTQSEPLRIGQH